MLKLKGWTTDPKFRKLKGFGAKIGAQLGLFLNWVGPRFDSQEAQGLFNNSAGANRYLLFWATGSRSDSLERSGTRDLFSRADLGSNSSG
jgi:hypothetical protein